MGSTWRAPREGEVWGLYVPTVLNGVFLKTVFVFVRENLTRFPYGQYIAGNICSLAF